MNAIDGERRIAVNGDETRRGAAGEVCAVLEARSVTSQGDSTPIGAMFVDRDRVWIYP